MRAKLIRGSLTLACLLGCSGAAVAIEWIDVPASLDDCRYEIACSALGAYLGTGTGYQVVLECAVECEQGTSTELVTFAQVESAAGTRLSVDLGLAEYWSLETASDSLTIDLSGLLDWGVACGGDALSITIILVDAGFLGPNAEDCVPEESPVHLLSPVRLAVSARN